MASVKVSPWAQRALVASWLLCASAWVANFLDVSLRSGAGRGFLHELLARSSEFVLIGDPILLLLLVHLGITIGVSFAVSRSGNAMRAFGCAAWIWLLLEGVFSMGFYVR